MDLGLNGKIAMIGGASRGLGFAVARALAKEGVQVSISSRNAEAIAAASAKIGREAGPAVLATVVDARSAEDIARWHAATMDRFGGVDLLYPNSGGPPPGPALKFDDAAWQNAFELLLLSAVRLIRLGAPVMAQRGGGAIVVPTSTAVKEPIPNLSLSTVVRSSVSALSKTLALELAPQKIRVNQLIPGRIDTDRVREIDAENSQRAGISIEEQRKRIHATIPLNSYGDPDGFAAAAVFLFSNAASYITGASLTVDGGLLRGI
ncbi:MAG: SDR family oxidoreductase [Bryobacterales bacterium]|nr:SDR family oxidoreductase [Bryobacterales bacterium]MBV9400859.1 SDR family oxidoreductase [Bryobacterales bacterium]